MLRSQTEYNSPWISSLNQARLNLRTAGPSAHKHQSDATPSPDPPLCFRPDYGNEWPDWAENQIPIPDRGDHPFEGVVHQRRRCRPSRAGGNPAASCSCRPALSIRTPGQGRLGGSRRENAGDRALPEMEAVMSCSLDVKCRALRDCRCTVPGTQWICYHSAVPERRRT
jgi:hypothetical protein